MPSNEVYQPPGERQLPLRFWRSARGFWNSKSAGWAWLLTVLLIVTIVLQLLTQYVVIAAWLSYCSQLMRLTVVSHSNSLLTPVVGLLLCTPKYVAGTMLLGDVVQAAAAFVMVQGACGWFTDNYPRLAEWAASTNRVASLPLALDKLDRYAKDDEPARICS